jgi:glycosyltransferase involved in cell wall biosynthesis
MSKPNVLVTLDSMKYPNTGLFHFGKSLGKALIKENNNDFDLNYYIDKTAEGYFIDNDVKLIKRIPLHKVVFAKRNSFNVIHFTDQFCRLKPQKFSGKKILTIHDLNQLYEESWSPQKRKEYMSRLGGYIDACDHIVAISNFVAGEISTHFPQTKDKLSVIYNGADKVETVDGHTPVYQPQRPFLFTIGMISAKKNFHVLPALLKDNDLELVIAGIESPYKNKIMDEAEKYGCLDRVKIIGTVSDEDKAWYYQNCTAFVFPSLAEGFGLPVIEAMHLGKPVFLSRHTSLPEVGGDAAWYFDSFDPEAMQNVLSKGMTEFHEKKLSETIKQHAGKFTWEQTAKQYLALYKKCIAG